MSLACCARIIKHVKDNPLKPQHISIKNLVIRFKWRISFTLGLVILESVLDLFFPLLIGLAINDLIAESYGGTIHLAILGFSLLTIGTCRRFYDTRV